jgi:uncharacterized protein
MPQRSSYTEGTPNWFDLQTNDVAAEKAFYGPLFGWTFDDQPTPDGQFYSMARKSDGVVAAIVPKPPHAHGTVAAAMWNTYLAVDDVEATVARVAAAGGKVVLAPVDVPDAGRLAFVTDPTAASVGLWQAGGHVGATIVNEPGAVIWNELLTDDIAAATRFYQDVVGLVSETSDIGHGPYTTLKARGDSVAGVSRSTGADAPSYWHVYFAVENATEAAEAATELGGEVLAGPLETAIGPMAALRDPLGAVFSVFQLLTDS